MLPHAHPRKAFEEQEVRKVRTLSLGLVSDAKVNVASDQGERCDSYNGVEVMRASSTPHGSSGWYLGTPTPGRDNKGSVRTIQDPGALEGSLPGRAMHTPREGTQTPHLRLIAIARLVIVGAPEGTGQKTPGHEKGHSRNRRAPYRSHRWGPNRQVAIGDRWSG